MAIEDRRDSSENSGGPSSGSHTFFRLVQALLEYTSGAPQKIKLINILVRKEVLNLIIVPQFY